MDGTLLIATDDSRLGALLSAEAEAAGVNALWEADALSAYDIAVSHQPEAILLDVHLPIHNGLELAAMLHADPDIPKETTIALLTDDAVDPHTLEKASLSGVFPKSHDAAALREWLVNAITAIR